MIEVFSRLGWLGLVAMVFGIVYVVLAAQGRRSCWIFGIVSCAIIAYEDIFKYRLYADAVLQTYYVIAGVWGLWSWMKNQRSEGTVVRTEFPLSLHVICSLMTLVAGWGLGGLLQQNSDAAVPFLDTWTTALSIFATFLLVRGYRSNWLYWMVADAFYVYIYASQGAIFYAVLMVIYLLFALWGWVRWGRLSRRHTR